MRLSLSLSFSPPLFISFVMVMQKKKSQRNICRSILFCAFSVEGQGHFSFLCAAQVLKVMKTIFHLQGVIWPGVAEQVCYGKINIMEGLTLLSLSHWDQCVFYWTGYIKQTSRPLLDKHTSVQACNTIHKCSWTHTHISVCVCVCIYLSIQHICFMANHPPCCFALFFLYAR